MLGGRADGGGLGLEVTDSRDANHWRWRRTEAGGGFLGDHAVAPDPTAPEYAELVSGSGYLK